MGGKKTTTSSNQQQTATTTLPAWMTAAGQQNYDAANAYVNSPEAVWSADKAAAYANPYTQQVIDRTKAGMTRDNAIELAGVNDQAQAAKAYGGTRHAVLEGQVRGDQADRLLNYEAGANADAYSAARAAFEADRAAKLGGYQTLTSILQGTPRNVTTSGTSSGTQTQKQSGSFLDTLLGVGQLGLSAYSTFSDRRLKTDVEWVDTLPNGLGVYRYHYVWDEPGSDLHLGVMADEVERIMPEALGPVIEGFQTVNYTKIAGVLA
jgi:hypothetical protein